MPEKDEEEIYYWLRRCVSQIYGEEVTDAADENLYAAASDIARALEEG